MRLIDADALSKKLLVTTIFLKDGAAFQHLIDDAPTVDVVRCKDCQHYEKYETWSACTYWSGDPYEQATVIDEDFCSYGEREGE